jgi:hypothetical protein
MTDVAKQYRSDFLMQTRSTYGHLFNQLNDSDLAVYAVHLIFHMDLLNISWNNPEFPPSKRAKSRYKKVDLDNRIKLLTDCVRNAMGIDDSRIFAGSQEKHHLTVGEAENLEVIIQEANPKTFGL